MQHSEDLAAAPTNVSETNEVCFHVVVALFFAVAMVPDRASFERRVNGTPIPPDYA